MTTLILDPARTAHMAIDMQRIFAEATAWQMQDFAGIVEPVAALAEAMPDRTIFTRFVTPWTADEARGRWVHYYRVWDQFTGRNMPPGLADLVERFAAHARDGLLLDKTTYSALEAPDCEACLARLNADTLVLSGVETDVCVLGTLMTAVDRGYRVVVARDAVGSSSISGHRATLEHILPRMPDQIDIATCAEIRAALHLFAA